MDRALDWTIVTLWLALGLIGYTLAFFADPIALRVQRYIERIRNDHRNR